MEISSVASHPRYFGLYPDVQQQQCLTAFAFQAQGATEMLDDLIIQSRVVGGSEVDPLIVLTHYILVQARKWV